MHLLFYLQNAHAKEVKAIEFEETETLSVIFTEALFLWYLVYSSLDFVGCDIFS